MYPKHYVIFNKVIELFDPIVAMFWLIVTFILEIVIMFEASGSRTDILGTCFIGLFACLMIYLSILLSYSVFKRMLMRNQSMAFLLCCSLARTCR